MNAGPGSQVNKHSDEDNEDYDASVIAEICQRLTIVTILGRFLSAISFSLPFFVPLDRILMK